MKRNWNYNFTAGNEQLVYKNNFCGIRLKGKIEWVFFIIVVIPLSLIILPFYIQGKNA